MRQGKASSAAQPQWAASVGRHTGGQLVCPIPTQRQKVTCYGKKVLITLATGMPISL